MKVNYVMGYYFRYSKISRKIKRKYNTITGIGLTKWISMKRVFSYHF